MAAHRALRRRDTTKAGPRAKSIPPRLVPATARAMERYAEAASAFELALADRRGLGRIDECYGALCECAATLLRSLVDDPGATRVFSSDIALVLSACARGEHVIGERPEEDVSLADRILGDAR